MTVTGVLDRFPETQEKGIATISHIELSAEDARHGNIHSMMSYGWGGGLMRVYEGKYVRLHINNELVMSDTDMEKKSNSYVIYQANGSVLIAGLGIGLVLKNILDKKEVTEVLVIEKYQDVIDIVKPKFEHDKLTVICADIFNWRPKKGELFDTLYFDIWSGICEDNLEEIRRLHNAFKYFRNRSNPNSYMNSWMKEYLQRQRANENRSRWRW